MSFVQRTEGTKDTFTQLLTAIKNFKVPDMPFDKTTEPWNALGESIKACSEEGLSDKSKKCLEDLKLKANELIGDKTTEARNKAYEDMIKAIDQYATKDSTAQEIDK